MTAPHELDVLFKAGHVQGVCCSEKASYLTHACGIEKLDWQGRHQKRADAPAHLGITRPNGKPHPGLDLQLLGLALNPKGRKTVDIGYSIAYGAQVISTDGKDLLVGVYGAGKDKGNPNRYNFTVLSPDLQVRKNLTFGCAEGLALVPPSVTGRPPSPERGGSAS